MVQNEKLHEWCEQILLEKVTKEEGRNGTLNKRITYKTLTQMLCAEPYVKCILNKKIRSALAKFRCGVAPIRIETGRYERNYPSVEERTCFNCANEVENEYHVLNYVI